MKTIKTIAIIFAVLMLILPAGASDVLWHGLQYAFAFVALIIYLPSRKTK